MRIRAVGFAALVLAFLAFAAVALAKEPTSRVYGAPGQDVDQQVGSAGDAGDVVTGTLPFTGLDLALLAAGATFLLLLGWGFRRLGRARAQA